MRFRNGMPVNGLKLMAVVAMSAGLSLMAQTVGASVEQSATANAGSSGAKQANVKAASSDSGTAAVEMRPVTAELQGKLDSKTAKVGDSVAVKTRAAVKTADGTTFPKGTRLTGHVTDVQAHEAGGAESRIGILLDRAELKGGQSLAIRSKIESVEPEVNAMATRTVESEDSFAAPSINASGRNAGGVGAGGNGLANTAVGRVAGATGNVGGSAGANSVLGAPVPDAALGERAVGSATANVGTSVHQVTGVSGGVVAHGTGIPGVSLAGNASATSSGTLFGSKKDFHLDGGTQIVLGVATAASVQ